MKRKLIDYTIISTSFFAYLQRNILEKAAEGWELQGSCTIERISDHEIYYQTMVKYEGSESLYFESHITIEPVFDDALAKATELAKLEGFKIANLLMQKREIDTPERSKHDTFMTGHSQSFGDLRERTIRLVNLLKVNDFKVWRYKIEDVPIDSRKHDAFGLL